MPSALPSGHLLGTALAGWPGSDVPWDRTTLEAWRAAAGVCLPDRWAALVQCCPRVAGGGWESRWHATEPAGPWAPNALVLLVHPDGVLALDTDPDDTGAWVAWWRTPAAVTRVASSWAALAGLVEQGPTALAAHLAGPARPPSLLHVPEADPHTRRRTWLEGLAPGAPVFCLDEPGQRLVLPAAWRRCPFLPWFGTPRAP